MNDKTLKPYLIRALYEWCSDNNETPYIEILVDETTIVPRSFVKDGSIILNISENSVDKIELRNDYISFQARFSGNLENIKVNIDRISMIFSKETKIGMKFQIDKKHINNNHPEKKIIDDKNQSREEEKLKHPFLTLIK